MSRSNFQELMIKLREQWRQDDIKRRLKAAFRRVRRPEKPKRDKDAP